MTVKSITIAGRGVASPRDSASERNARWLSRWVRSLLLRTLVADENIDRQPTRADGQDFGHQIKDGKHCNHDTDPPFSWDRTICLLFATGSRPLNSLRRRGWYWDKGDLILSLSQYIYWVHSDDMACPSPILRKNQVEVPSDLC